MSELSPLQENDWRKTIFPIYRARRWLFYLGIVAWIVTAVIVIAGGLFQQIVTMGAMMSRWPSWIGVASTLFVYLGAAAMGTLGTFLIQIARLLQRGFERNLKQSIERALVLMRRGLILVSLMVTIQIAISVMNMILTVSRARG